MTRPAHLIDYILSAQTAVVKPFIAKYIDLSFQRGIFVGFFPLHRSAKPPSWARSRKSQKSLILHIDKDVLYSAIKDFTQGVKGLCANSFAVLYAVDGIRRKALFEN